MWEKYNPNPVGRTVGDCSVRALAKALGISWEEAYALTSNAGFNMGDMPSADSVWGAVLRQHGFYKKVCDNDKCGNAAEFVLNHPKGVYVLGFGGHVATVRDGVLYDAWNSLNEIPVYYWYKEE